MSSIKEASCLYSCLLSVSTNFIKELNGLVKAKRTLQCVVKF